MTPANCATLSEDGNLVWLQLQGSGDFSIPAAVREQRMTQHLMYTNDAEQIIEKLEAALAKVIDQHGQSQSRFDVSVDW